MGSLSYISTAAQLRGAARCRAGQPAAAAHCRAGLLLVRKVEDCGSLDAEMHAGKRGLC